MLLNNFNTVIILSSRQHVLNTTATNKLGGSNSILVGFSRIWMVHCGDPMNGCNCYHQPFQLQKMIFKANWRVIFLSWKSWFGGLFCWFLACQGLNRESTFWVEQIFGPFWIFGLSRAKNNVFDIVCFWPFFVASIQTFWIDNVVQPKKSTVWVGQVDVWAFLVDFWLAKTKIHFIELKKLIWFFDCLSTKKAQKSTKSTQKVDFLGPPTQKSTKSTQKVDFFVLDRPKNQQKRPKNQPNRVKKLIFGGPQPKNQQNQLKKLIFWPWQAQKSTKKARKSTKSTLLSWFFVLDRPKNQQERPKNQQNQLKKLIFCPRQAQKSTRKAQKSTKSTQKVDFLASVALSEQNFVLIRGCFCPRQAQYQPSAAWQSNAPIRAYQNIFVLTDLFRSG